MYNTTTLRHNDIKFKSKTIVHKSEQHNKKQKQPKKKTTITTTTTQRWRESKQSYEN